MSGRVVFCSTPAGGGNFASEPWSCGINTPGRQRLSFKSTGQWIDQILSGSFFAQSGGSGLMKTL